MSNWDRYQAGINILAGLYLSTLFLRPDIVILNVLMLIFFGWLIGAGIVVYALEGAE